MSTKPSPTLTQALIDVAFINAGNELEPVGDVYRPEGVALVMLQALGLDPLWTVERLQADLAIAQRARALPAADEITSYWGGGCDCRAAVLGETP